MNRLWMLLLVLALLGLSARSARADFVYANFATANSTSGGQTLQVNGSASVGYKGNQLQLTPSSPSQGGSAFTKNAISLGTNGSFSTYFQFQLSNSGGISDEDGVGADGIVFVVQTVSNNVGAVGAGIGYFGIPNSIGIEFDTFDNSEGSGNHVGVDENGGLQDFGAVNEPTRFNNGQIWNAWIDYDGNASDLEVRWSLLPTRPASSMLTLGGVNLPAILGTNNAFVGFTAATGAGYNDQDILNWQFNQINPSAWIGATDANWATPSNWLGPVPGATTGTTNTDTATFNQNAPNSPLGIDAGRNIKNITFDTANVNSMTIGTTGGNALLLTAGGTVQMTSTVVNPQTINCPLVLEGDYRFTSGAASTAATLTFSGRITPGATSGVMTLTLGGINAGNNTISGVLADNGAGKLAVAMAGPGVWALSGANTFSGITTITGGKLVLQNSAALQMSTLSLAIDNGTAFAAGLGSATLGGLSGSGKLTLQDQATTPAAVNVMVGNNGASTNYGGILSGAGSLTKIGAGTLILANSNTYTGGTSINAGTLQLGDGISANGSVPGNITDKATLVFANPNSQTYSGVISGAGAVAKTANGTLVLSGPNSFSGGLNVQQGTLSIPTINNLGTSGALGAGPGVSLGSMGQTGTLEYTGGTASSNMPFSLAAGGSGVFQIDMANTNLNLSGVVSGSGTLTKSGAGTLILAGNNTFTGGLNVQQGTLSIPTINNLGTSGALGAGPGISLGSMGQTGTLEYTGSTASSNMPFSLTTGGGAFQIDTAATNFSLSGVVSGSGSLTKSGIGTLILGANNSFTGGVTINAGIVRLSNSGALNAGTPNSIHFGPGSSGVLDLGGSGNITISSLQSNTLPGAPIVENANPPLGPLSTLTINDSGTDTFAGVMRDDPGGRGVLAIAKSGSGTLVLTGANTHTGGTTINSGTIQLGDGATSNGSVAGNISDNSGLVFANPNAQVYSGILSGPGSVTKSAAGALTLGGNNSFTGGLTVQQGTLVINTINYAHSVGSLGANANVALASSGQTATLEYTGGTASSDMPFTLTTGGNSAFQIDAAAAALTLSGVPSGGGNLIKSGPGALILAGNSSYTGSTTVNNGTLTTTTGTVGGGPLAINGNSGAIAAVSFGKSQSIASLSGTISAGGSAGVNVGAGKALTVNQSSNTTFAGTIALTTGATAGGGGVLVKSGIGSLEIDGSLSLGNNSSLAISGGKLRLNVTSGSGSVGSGVSANITSSAVLELAGSVAALGTITPGNRVTITNASSAAAGILISAGNQQVGGIGGSGKTQVNAGANLIADHIIQNALIIGGTSGSHAVVTIDASDASGNPLGQSSGLTLAGSLTPSAPFGAGAFTASTVLPSGGPSANSSSLSGSDLGGSAAVVPEPTTLMLALFGLASVGCRPRRNRK